jgi:P-type conjugative transfer protein TrbG
MIPINRSNLRDAVAIAVGIVAAWAFSGCAEVQPPPPAPTAAQLAPMPQPPAPRPRITGAMILSRQPPEVQQAIDHGPPWLTFRWPRQRLVPYTEHSNPLTLEVSPTDDVDLALQHGETIDGVSLGDSEEFMVAPIMSALPHLILKCKVTGKDTTGAVYVSSGRIYRLHLRCRDHTTLDSVSYYYPEQLLAVMHAADAAPATPPQQADPIAPTVDASRINHSYKIDGPTNIPWRPIAAMDDGTRVWIELPKTTSPIAPVLTIDGGQVVNYRTRGQYIVLDALFNKAQLASGSDHITITRVSQ